MTAEPEDHGNGQGQTAVTVLNPLWQTLHRRLVGNRAAEHRKRGASGEKSPLASCAGKAMRHAQRDAPCEHPLPGHQNASPK